MLRERLQEEQFRIERALKNPSSVVLPAALISPKSPLNSARGAGDRKDVPEAPSELMQRGRLAMEFRLDTKRDVVVATGSAFDAHAKPAAWFMCASEDFPQFTGRAHLTLIKELAATKSLYMLAKPAKTHSHSGSPRHGSAPISGSANLGGPSYQGNSGISTPSHYSTRTVTSSSKASNPSTGLQRQTTPVGPFPSYSSTLPAQAILQVEERVKTVKSDSFKADVTNFQTSVKSSSAPDSDNEHFTDHDASSTASEDWDDMMDDSPTPAKPLFGKLTFSLGSLDDEDEDFLPTRSGTPPIGSFTRVSPVPIEGS